MKIWEDRNDPVMTQVIWDDNRLRMGDTFYSFWEHGRLTEAEVMRREEQQLYESAKENADFIQKAKANQSKGGN